MVLSKRERYIVILTLSIVGAFALDWFVVTPLRDRKRAVDDSLLIAESDVARLETDLLEAARSRRNWSNASGNTIKRDASEVESQVNNSVREWANEARMSFTGFRRESTEREKGFTKITYSVNGNGNMEQIGRFLFRVQTSKIPIRITDVTLTSKPEGTDNLTLSLKVASIFEQPENPRPAGQPAPRENQANIHW